MKYDYLIVGSGLFGATFANLANKNGKKVMVIDKRSNVAGNVYTETIEGIQVHKYGAHIFHTDYKDVWDYVNSFVEFNRYTNSPIARIGNEIYNMPFNMNTFAKIWDDVFTPEDALRMKPDPYIYQRVIKELKVKPEETLVFEDSLIGIQAARAAGIETVAIYDQYADHEHEAIKALADHYIENYGQALKTLQKDWP